MSEKLRKEICNLMLIFLLGLIAGQTPLWIWKAFQAWEASQGVWIEADMEERVA